MGVAVQAENSEASPRRQVEMSEADMKDVFCLATFAMAALCVVAFVFFV
jgi:hypothetical protein